MENKKIAPSPNWIYIVRTNNTPPEIDPEVMNWLARFVERLQEESFRFEDHNIDFDDEFDDEPSIMEQLEYFDSTVEGDEHPEALDLIMNAYYKYKNS